MVNKFLNKEPKSSMLRSVKNFFNRSFKIKDDVLGDKLFKGITFTFSFGIIMIITATLVTMFIGALPSIKEFGLKFYVTDVWDVSDEVYGALAFIVGTVLTSFIALAISIPFSLSIAILLGSYLKKGPLAEIIKTTTELLAGIPSVIYGFWGFIFLLPIVRKIAEFVGSGHTEGVGILTAAIILAIMIIPYTASIAREVIEMVPNDLEEAAYAMGATKLDVVLKVVIPYSMSGIFAGIVLSLGRALGETMAVTMLIGNKNIIPKSLFSPANTIASVIADYFGEADGVEFATLIQLGFVLMIITSVINFLGKLIIKKFTYDT